MDISIFHFFIFFLFIFFIDCSLSARTCKPSSCSGMGPEIKFPFRLKGKQEEGCGYPGFDLSCNNQSQTILSLPASGDFVVTEIDYVDQAIYINDPEFCLAKRISKFSSEGSRFSAAHGKNYTFYNCSSVGYMYSDRVMPMFCLGNKNYEILVATSHLSAQGLPPSCIRMANISVHLQWFYAQYWSSPIISEAAIKLVWDKPRCQVCEIQQQYCGFSSNSGSEIGCFSTPSRKAGLPRSAKYGVIIGVGVPGLVCMIGLACYTCGRIRNFRVRRDLNTDQSTAVANPPRSIAITGLDSPTIESYPKTELGESRRLPNPTDGTCPVCLSDYQPKETLRTIPECNHYFHAVCIDEWLRLNGTCPLCRNAPDSMSMTPCSSMSSTFSSSSTSTTQV